METDRNRAKEQNKRAASRKIREARRWVLGASGIRRKWMLGVAVCQERADALDATAGTASKWRLNPSAAAQAATRTASR